MSSTLRLRRIALKRFRAFRDEVLLDELSTFNVIAGPNNVGKSSLLMPLRWLTRMSPEMVPLRGVPDGTGVAGKGHTAIARASDGRDGERPALLRLEIEVPPGEGLWPDFFSNGAPFERPCEGSERLEIEIAWPEAPDRHLDFRFSVSACKRLAAAYQAIPLQTRKAMRGVTEPTIAELQHLAVALATSLAKRIVYVPHALDVGASLERPDESRHQERRYDGASLLADLLSWHLPGQDGRNNLEPGAELNRQVSSVLRAPTRIWPTAEKEIKISIGGDPARRLQDLGGGVTQVVTIVAAILRMPVSPILLLEEPETCLHPGLQRQLVDHLVDHGCQTFVTTHSNHLIDAAWKRGRLYLVQSEGPDRARTVTGVEKDFLGLLHDLGVSASSIAAARAVIWVEGPSDAIYLRHWLSRWADDDLVEGRDFAFAFHSGSLLAHVGFDEGIVNPLSLHPGFYFVADSDRRAKGADAAHPYLRRFLENDEVRDRLWVTQPKEIEGYIPDAALADDVPAGIASTRYESLPERLDLLGRSHPAKVRLAQQVVRRLQEMSDDEVFESNNDLRDQVSRLRMFIESCRERLPYVSR